MLSPNFSLADTSFLGTMAGEQVFKTTYTREYDGADDIRKKIFDTLNNYDDGEGIKTLGEHYSFTPLGLRDGRNFGAASTTWQGGGFFLTLQKLDESDKKISSLEYVTRAMGPQLESISGLCVEELIKQFRAYGQDYLLYYFFEPVLFPKDGDLVIYPGTKDSSPNYGIFKESKPNWNSPFGGTVESKWEYDCPYVFQHDIFFVPALHGNVAKFYRVKSEMVKMDTLAIKPHSEDQDIFKPLFSSNTIYTLKEDGSLIFNFLTKENEERRKIIDRYRGKNLTDKLSEIQHLSYIKFMGKCHHYAFGKILSTYSQNIEMPDPQIHGKELLEKHFTVTTAPQKGDLVVYYNSSITHWGIYLGNGMVESKWGDDLVYRHFLFDVPTEYGNTIKCFRLNDGLTVEALSANLKLLKTKTPCKF